jgi:hypothetical protein
VNGLGLPTAFEPGWSDANQENKSRFIRDGKYSITGQKCGSLMQVLFFVYVLVLGMIKRTGFIMKMMHDNGISVR